MRFYESLSRTVVKENMNYELPILRRGRPPDSRLYFICNDETSPKRIKRPFAQDAFQNLKDGRPAPIAGTQEQDPGMRPGLVPSNIGKAQVHGDEELSFARNMLPDNRISLSGKALIMHSACLMTCLLTAAQRGNGRDSRQTSQAWNQSKGRISSSRVRSCGVSNGRTHVVRS